MAYQTFPWVKGDSSSYDKLRSLNLPNLKEKTFLDVGCNEGYFCGYADFMGAAEVTGIDKNPQFLAVAKALFPKCKFICQNWDDLDNATYDVILCASAIHYAADQKKLLDMLVSRLNPYGVLVLEIGVAPGAGNEFMQVKRSIDSRLFPTRLKLEEMLAGHAFKYIGKSVLQAGDPIERHVYHISRKLPYAILVLDTPHAGKTFTVSHIFNKDIKRISGDRLYHEIAAGKISAPESIREIIAQNRQGMDCSKITHIICKKGLVPDFCSWLAGLAGQKDFILDMYIPALYHKTMAAILEKENYYVLSLGIQKAVSHPRFKEVAAADSCYDYARYLQKEFVIDEKEYLAANPDVAEALAAGKITGAFAHYIFHGRQEGRKRSLKRDDS